MRQMIMNVLMVASIVIGALIPFAGMPSVAAQDDPGAPLYIRYCPRTSDNLLVGALDVVETRLQAIDVFMTEYNDGFKTALEGINTFNEALAEWDRAEKLDCLAPLNADVQKVLSEFLISMLYLQLGSTAEFNAHFEEAQATLVEIRARKDQALTYLNQPVVSEPTPEPAPDTSDPGEPRPEAELEALMTTYLLNNGVTLLQDATFVYTDTGAIVTVSIDPFQNLNFENAVFTMDVLAELMAGWQEMLLIERVIVQVVDGAGNEVLYVEATGGDFRAYFYDNTLTQEQFETNLIRIE